jgi:4-alpha-glucanotransferase
MPVEAFQGALERAAERCGVEPCFWDIFGHEHRASTEALQALIAALGVRADSVDSIASDLAKRERDDWERVVAPAIVVTPENGTVAVPLMLPEAEGHATARVRVTLESGEVLNLEIPLAGCPVEERATIDGAAWVRILAPLQIGDALGYHQIQVDCGTKKASAALISAPARAWQPEMLSGNGKMAGFGVALYGLRSARNWGVGDFTDLRRICSWAARELGVSFLAVNPLHAIHNRRPYNTSPYLPVTIFFQNSLYLDVEAIEEWQSCGRSRRLFATAEMQRELHLLREASEVQYERVFDLKNRFLKLLFVEFLERHWSKGTARDLDFRSFLKEAGELSSRYGLYCALNEHLHSIDPNLWVWTNWPSEYQDPTSVKSLEFARKHWRSVLFHQWAAWQTSVQLDAAQKHAKEAGLSLGLYHDLPLATDRWGSDIWAHRDFFASGCRVGSPPDDFSPQGQDWGFPPPNTRRHQEDGYHLFRESIRRTCQFGGALRIDHVMRFFRLYWIPDGMDATQGAYVRDRAEDLVRIVVLESVRNQVLVVGEDLGTVEPYIREMLGKFGILSYRLFYFEREGDGSYKLPGEYPRQALVSSTTHDLPTLTGFWRGSDIEARVAAGVLDEKGRNAQWVDRTRDKQRMLEALERSGILPASFHEEAAKAEDLTMPVHDAIIAFLASTPSMLMVVNQEDLTLEPGQQNLPGTTSQYPNWGRKMLFTLEQLDVDERARELSRHMRTELARENRLLNGRGS